mgnify:FL=1
MVVATGFFDGVHLGHRFILRTLVEEAAARGDESMVVTFWPHPRNVLQDDARNLRLLTSMEEKKALLKSIGVDHIEVLPFSKAFSRLTAEEYLKEYVIGKFGGNAILLGYDNRLGSDLCTPEQTAALAEKLGLDVIRPESYTAEGGIVVSSTKIRNAVASGDIVLANSMLGYDYQLFGVVVSGNRLGHTIGFPTANMQLYEPLKLVPGNGVYLVKVETLGNVYDGMCNIGIRPTFGSGNTVTIETNIFDFDEDIYGLDIRVSFVCKIRDEVKFNDLSLLAAQLEKDRTHCRNILDKNDGIRVIL